MFTVESEEDDVAKTFIEWLQEYIKDIYNKFKFPKKIKFGSKEKRKYEEATNCDICGGSFVVEDDADEKEKEKMKKVRDHCHFTGKFRGAAHNSCNLLLRKPKFFPVIFHNLAGYDAHLFVKGLGFTEGKIDCIPNNEEKYISFSKETVVDTITRKDAEVGEVVKVKRSLRFIDSFRFMASGLGRLVANLEKRKLVNLQQFYEGRRLDLLLRNDWFDSFERLAETSLPQREAFYSKLNNEHISEQDYEHAQQVWKKFQMKTMRDYHDLYLETDVLLLADVFENFRNVCMEHYKLDPTHYYTSPGLAWDAALRKTGVRLELLTDPDMLLMEEKGIRGGVSMISTRYGKANNPYMSDWDPSQPTKSPI